MLLTMECKTINGKIRSKRKHAFYYYFGEIKSTSAKLRSIHCNSVSKFHVNANTVHTVIWFNLYRI